MGYNYIVGLKQEKGLLITGTLKKSRVQDTGILLYINYIVKQMDVVKEGHLL